MNSSIENAKARIWRSSRNLMNKLCNLITNLKLNHLGLLLNLSKVARKKVTNFLTPITRGFWTWITHLAPHSTWKKRQLSKIKCWRILCNNNLTNAYRSWIGKNLQKKWSSQSIPFLRETSLLFSHLQKSSILFSIISLRERMCQIRFLKSSKSKAKAQKILRFPKIVLCLMTHIWKKCLRIMDLKSITQWARILSNVCILSLKLILRLAIFLSISPRMSCQWPPLMMLRARLCPLFCRLLTLKSNRKLECSIVKSKLN